MPRARALAEVRSRRRWTAAEASAVVAALDSSGLSVARFAVREDVDPQRLYMWRRRLRSDSSAAGPAFVEIHAPATSVFEVVLRTGHVLRVAPSFDAAALRRLIAVLEEVSPSC